MQHAPVDAQSLDIRLSGFDLLRACVARLNARREPLPWRQLSGLSRRSSKFVSFEKRLLFVRRAAGR